jgi:hypothetical protein
VSAGATLSPGCLVEAAGSGDQSVVDYVLPRGHWTGEELTGALEAACDGGNLDMYTTLVNSGATLSPYCLVGAARGGNVEVLDSVLAGGQFTPDQMVRALEGACEWGKLECYTRLVERGVPVSEKCLQLARDRPWYEGGPNPDIISDLTARLGHTDSQ